MNRNIFIGILALVLVIVVGIVEVIVIDNSYQEVHDSCQAVAQDIKNDKITLDKYQQFVSHWERLREKSEIFLPHQDVYEITLRIAETRAWLELGNLEDAYAQICVVQKLLDYVPHLIKPTWRHIV